MGYRVGHQCVETKLQADDLVLSAQPPLLTQDGQILRPIRQQNGWYYQGKSVELTYPSCNAIEQVQQGAVIGGSLVLLFAVAYCFRLAIKAIMDFTRVEGSSNDS